MTKNVTVFDSEGKIVGTTWPRRAAGLVKNGRARYYGGVETAIILARSPDIDLSSEEDEQMSNFTNEELRAKIEEMVREAREKLDAVCKTAADAIDDLVENVDNIEENETDSPDLADDIGDIGDIGDMGDMDDMDDMDGDGTGEVSEHERGFRFIRITDEDMEKLKSKMKSLRDSLGVAVDEAKSVAVKAGTEIGKYAEAVKVKVSEKIAEARSAEAEAKAKAEADAAASNPEPGTEAYYLRKIEELSHDTAHFASLERLASEFRRTLESDTSESSEGTSPAEAMEQLTGVAAMREERLRKTMDFYMEQVRDIRNRHDEAAK